MASSRSAKSLPNIWEMATLLSSGASEHIKDDEPFLSLKGLSMDYELPDAPTTTVTALQARTSYKEMQPASSTALSSTRPARNIEYGFPA